MSPRALRIDLGRKVADLTSEVRRLKKKSPPEKKLMSNAREAGLKEAEGKGRWETRGLCGCSDRSKGSEGV